MTTTDHRDGSTVTDINITIDLQGPRGRQAIEIAVAMMTAFSTFETTAEWTRIMADLLQDHLNPSESQEEAIGRLGELAVVFVTLASAAATGAFFMGREAALAEGEASSERIDMTELLPFLAQAMQQMLPETGPGEN